MSKAFKLPKTAGGMLSLVFKILGIVVVAGPAINATIADLQKQDFSNFGNDILYAYTGYSVPGQNLNVGQLGAGIASIAGGVGLMKVGQIIGRMVR